MKNPHVAAGGGAGIQTAQSMADKEVRAILTGNCGPNAFQVLKAADIDVMVGINGTVREAVRKYKEGGITATPEPAITSHSDIGMRHSHQGDDKDHHRGIGPHGEGKRQGRGMGAGRGLGRCREGKGRGMGHGRGMTPNTEASDKTASAEESDNLPPTESRSRLLEPGSQIPHSSNEAPQSDATLSPLIAVVDTEICIGCGACLQSCPQDAIDFTETAIIDPQKCNGCGRCIEECPQEAISLQKRATIAPDTF